MRSLGGRSRWGALGVFGLVLACASLSASASGSAGVGRCGAHQAETLARTRDLRVYAYFAEGQHAFACGPALAHPVPIGPIPPRSHLLFARIEKPVVIHRFTVGAVEDRAEGEDFGTTWVRVVGVRSQAASECEVGPWVNGAGLRVRKLLLSPTGILVWAARDEGANPRALGLCGQADKGAVIDEDPGLEVGGVRLNGDVLRWRDSSGPHSLRLDPSGRLPTRP